MELMKIVWIYFFMEFVKGSLKPIKTTPSLNVILHHTPTLTCTYTYEPGNEDLIFIRWHKKILNGNSSESVRLALMREGRDPAWLSSAPEEFKKHVTLLKTIEDNSVSFDLRIDGLVCDDEGTYECQIYTFSEELSSTTDLRARAHPGSPRIHDDVIEVKENDSFSLHCHGDVGIPPIALRWLYKERGTNVFQMINEGIKQENSRSRDCKIKGTSSLRVMMSKKLDGAVFLCATTAEIGEEGSKKFDQVQLQLHRTTTTTKATTTTTAACHANGRKCPPIDDGGNSAPVNAQSVLGTALVVLLTTFVSRTVFRS